MNFMSGDIIIFMIDEMKMNVFEKHDKSNQMAKRIQLP